MGYAAGHKGTSIHKKMSMLLADEEAAENEREEKLEGEPVHVQRWSGMMSSVRRMLRAYQSLSSKTGGAVGVLNTPKVAPDENGMMTIGFRMKCQGPFILPNPMQALQLKTWTKQMASALRTNSISAEFAGVFVRPLNASTLVVGAAFTSAQQGEQR